MTDRQHDAPVVALAHGYYEVPRKTNQKELAQILGTSPASLSELLGRAEAVIIEDSLTRSLRPAYGPRG